MKLRNTFLLLTMALAMNAVHASSDAQIDLTNSGFQITGPNALRINNLTMKGAKVPMTAEFIWDSKAGALKMVSKAPDTRSKWRVSNSTVKYSPANGSFSKDLNAVCVSEFGSGYVYADWADVKGWVANDPQKAQTFINSVGLNHVGSNYRFVLTSYQMRPFSSMVSPTDTSYLNGVTLNPSGAKDNVLGGTITVAGQWAQSHLDYNILCNNKAEN